MLCSTMYNTSGWIMQSACCHGRKIQTISRPEAAASVSTESSRGRSFEKQVRKQYATQILIESL